MDEVFRKTPWVFYLLIPILLVCVPVISIAEGIKNKTTARFTMK